MDVELPLNDRRNAMATDTGRGTRKGAVKKRSQRRDGTKALDQAKPL